MTVFGNDNKPKKKLYMELEDLYIDYSYIILIQTNEYYYHINNLNCYMYLDDPDYAKACVWSVITKQTANTSGLLLTTGEETSMPEGWGWKTLQLDYVLEPNTEYYVGFIFRSVYPTEDKLYYSKKGAQHIYKKGFNNYDVPEDLNNTLAPDNNNGPNLIYINADVYDVNNLLKINTINIGNISILSGVGIGLIKSVSTIEK